MLWLVGQCRRRRATNEWRPRALTFKRLLVFRGPADQNSKVDFGAAAPDCPSMTTRPSLSLSSGLWFACLFAALALATLPLWARGITEHAVQFPRGKSGTTVKGSVTGDEVVDYRLRAAAGQTMTVTKTSGGGSVYFNVLPPGSNDVAMFVGSRDGNEFRGALPADGEYRIRVYQMGDAKDSGRKSNFAVAVSITGPAAAATAAKPSHSERAGRGRFDARGRIACAQALGQPMGQCDFAVARDPGGSASVKVTMPDGRARFLFFEKGKALSADLSQADGDMTFRATREADLYRIQAGRERYEIPEAVVCGG